MTTFRAAIRVQPGARTEQVGGRGPTDRPDRTPPLLVSVRARPVDGQATAAALRAVAGALGVRPRQVRLVSGSTSREKLIEVLDAPTDVEARWAALLGPRG